MIEKSSTKSLYRKTPESLSKSKDLEARMRREEKLLEDEILEMARYIKSKLTLGLDIFRIQLPDSAFDIKKIIFFILNKPQRKLSDNIILRQYLVSYPDFIDTLKLRDQLSDPKELLLKISSHLKKEEIYQDNVIFYNGQLGKSFYLILEGEVSILIPYEYRIKITDKQLFKYMSFLLQHKDYELIRLILESNSTILNDDDYKENELYSKFKSVIDKALPLYMETEKISSHDYVKRYNFFEDIENKNIMKKIKKIKKSTKPEKNKEKKEKKKKEENKDNKDIEKDDNQNNQKETNSKEKDKKEKNKKKGSVDETPEEKDSPKKTKNYYYNIETIFTVWKYFEVVRLSKGKCFGELALQKEGKKRTATIITTQNSVFGILQKDVYQMFIKETMDKARKANVELLLKSKLFRGCNSEKFENNYFNCFKFMKKYKGEYLFKQGEERQFIFFIKKGEVQIELYSTCFNIDNIVENLGYSEEDNSDLKELIKNQKKIELFCNINRKFNVIIFSGDAIGLNDHIVSDNNEELVFSGLCVTYCELFALDKKVFNKMMDDKIIKNNLNKMVKERKERLCERLLQLRSNIILQHYNFIKENSEKYDTLSKNKNFFDEANNTINKKKEYKKYIVQDINGEQGHNIYDGNNSKGIFLKKRFENNFNKTLGQNSIIYNNNPQTTNTHSSEKNYHKNSNLLNTDSNFYKSKNRINNKSKNNKKISLKALDFQDVLSRNDKIKLKTENNKTNDNNFNINISHIKNEKIIKEISKFSNLYFKNDNNSELITQRYPEKESNNMSKKESVKNNNERSNNIAIKQKSKTINNLGNFIKFGNYKLHKLLLKQSMIYNTEIDKIDKIIINNFDKVSPLSCKILINKEKEKSKLFGEIETEPIFDKERNNLNKRKNVHIKIKEKEKKYKSITKIEKKIKARNNFSLPIVLSKSNKNNEQKLDSQNIFSREIKNFFTVNK